MTIEEQNRISIVVFIMTILALCAYSVLFFYVPVYASYLQQTTARLTFLQRLVIYAWDFARHTGLIAVPFLILCFIAALVWRINFFVRLRQFEHENRGQLS